MSYSKKLFVSFMMQILHFFVIFESKDKKNISKLFEITAWFSHNLLIFNTEPFWGLEPQTYSLRMNCSTNWAKKADKFGCKNITYFLSCKKFSQKKIPSHILKDSFSPGSPLNNNVGDKSIWLKMLFGFELWIIRPRLATVLANK